MISKKQKTNLFKQKLKTGFKATLIASLILTESILISCERFNGNNNDEGVKMFYVNKKTEEEEELMNLKESETPLKLSLTETFNNFPNTNIQAKMENDKVYVNRGNEKFILNNEEKFNVSFERKEKVYLVGVSNNSLVLSEYLLETSENEINSERTFNFNFLMSKEEKIKSFSIDVSNNKIFVEGIKIDKENNEKKIGIEINLEGLDYYNPTQEGEPINPNFLFKPSRYSEI